MTDIVIIPTYDRPELLWLCVEHLAKCDGIQTKRVVIQQDYHVGKPISAETLKEIDTTVEYARLILPYVTHARIIHDNYGCSYNFIRGFRRGYESDAKFVYHIEDDVFVTKDWFRFAEAAHELCPDAFVVTGNSRPQSRSIDPSAVHLSYWFQTFALSFRREQLHKILLPNYSDYKLQKNFEFDTYCMNWMAEHKQYSAAACQERAFTFGYYSYHIGGERSPGTLQERIQHIRDNIKNPDQLGGGYAKDFIPYKEPGGWTTLTKRSSLPQKGTI